VDEVVAAGGSVVLPRGPLSHARTSAYERRALLANHHRKVPPGTRLEIRRTQQHVEIKLVEAPVVPPPGAAPTIRVPERIQRLHPAARVFRDDAACHRVSRDQLARAVRVLHVVATEAARRGWSPSAPEGTHESGSPIAPIHRRDQLVLEVHDMVFWIRLRERGVHTRGWWEEQKHAARPLRDLIGMPRDRRLAGASYDADASGVLTLELHCEHDSLLFAGRRSQWSDGQRQRLESCVGLFFREIDERVAEAEQHAEICRRAADRSAQLERKRLEERAATWRDLMTSAECAWRDAMFATELRRQLDADAHAREVRRYCDAAEIAHGDDRSTREWLAWAREYATRIDPLSRPPAAPQLSEPTPADLQPYLPPSWSAHGPPSS